VGPRASLDIAVVFLNTMQKKLADVLKTSVWLREASQTDIFQYL